MSLTDLYNKYGVDNYYCNNSDNYTNPHIKQITELLTNNYNKIYQGNILDLGCGTGQVSTILFNLGYKQNITGCDPYLYKSYIEHTKQPCLKYSFSDIIKQGLPTNYTSIICSFAMHLCAKDKLSALIYRLALVTKQIIIITPHKRPEIDKIQGFNKIFTAKAYTNIGKAVYLKIYIK